MAAPGKGCQTSGPYQRPGDHNAAGSGRRARQPNSVQRSYLRKADAAIQAGSAGSDFERPMQGITRAAAKHMVGPGWGTLIDEAYDRLTKGAIVTTVKEKYGTLRIYADGIDDKTWDFLCCLEDKSSRICERCGKPGKPRDDGWIKTLCDKCHAKGT